MAYIGRQPVVGNYSVLDAITATTTDTYALTKASVAVFPQTPANCIVSLNGVIQAPFDSYTISGSNIVFASALTGSDSIDFITVLGDVLNVGTVSDGTIGLAKLSATGTKDATTFLRGDNTFAEAGGIFESALLHVRDEKSAGVDGGSSVSGSFNTRDLNTVLTNEISGASLASNQITLPSGTYFIIATVPTYTSQYAKVKLRNITDSTDALLGTSSYSGTNVSTFDSIYGRFTIGATKTFAIQQRVSLSLGTYGLGLAENFGVTEVYTDSMIWKVA